MKNSLPNQDKGVFKCCYNGHCDKKWIATSVTAVNSGLLYGG